MAGSGNDYEPEKTKAMTPNKEFMIDCRNAREILAEIVGVKPNELFDLNQSVKLGNALIAIMRAQNEVLASANASLARQLNRKTPTS